MREIVLDTETTGLDPDSGHRIVEIGAVEMMNHIATGQHFHTYLNPERDMPAEAQQVHGLSAEFLKDKPLFATIAAGFLDFIGDAPLVIHNASFDMKFINAELRRVHLEDIPVARTIDTVALARRKFPGQPASLDALCRRFGIDLSQRVKHGALLDAELLADVYLELCGGRQVSLHLQADEPQQKPTLSESPTSQTQKEYSPRSFPLSEDEKEAHLQMLSKLSEPLWHRYHES